MSEQWNGIQRDASTYYVETCYSLYADMSGTDAPYLNVNGLCLYSDSGDDLEAILPATVTVRVGSGTAHTFYATTPVKSGAYSPSGNWMRYFVYISSTEEITIPSSGTTFTISVTVTPTDDDPFTFTETAHRPIANTLTAPASMVTGRAYEFTTSAAVPAGQNYSNKAVLTWYPQAVGAYTTQAYEEGYINPYTRAADATAGFTSVYFAVPNMDGISDGEAASFTADAHIMIQARYKSASFTGGILISECSASTPCTPRSAVDSDLAPTLTAANVSISCTPSNAAINGKYVHKQATLTLTPTATFKYGDAIAYIHLADGTNRYNSSISLQAEGVAPGTTYTRPDTGATATAGQSSIGGVSLCVYGNKWKLSSSTVTKTYTVLYYHAPRIPTFSIHRCTTSTSSTSYQYNGTYYKKDDFGSYCLIEYTVDFSALDDTNSASMIIQYGTHRVNLTPSYSGSGFIVVSAGTAAMDVIAMLYDTFYPYGVSVKQTLSVAGILLDWLAGGKGMAVGKQATTANALDITSDWKLLFYKATVGAYSGDNAQDLVAWMHDIDTRLTALESGSTAN